MKKVSIREEMKRARKTHGIWYDFCDHMKKWYFIRRPTVHFRRGKVINGKRSFKEFSSTKMIGFRAMCRVDAYAEKHPEIKVITVDDAFHAGSSVVLVPHPKMGITVIYIPQCATDDLNQFFMYPHCSATMIEEIAKMKKKCQWPRWGYK